MKKIIVTVTNDLSTDQRVAKVCNTLISNNFEVLLLGRKLKNSKNLKRNYQTKRFRLLFNAGFLFFAEYNFRLFFYLLFTKKDILLSNDLDTLLPNYLVGKIQNKKIVFDSHELFPEIPELVNRPKVKKTWLALEKWMLPRLRNNYTVCNSIAGFYKKKYNCSFETIMNLPTEKKVELGEFPFKINGKKIILYQGAINVGRGLEKIIETMNFLENHLLVIIGEGDIYKLLKDKVSSENLNNKVVFLGKITPSELHKLTPLAHLGISLEEDLGLNYRFALPNKIFDYIQAEVPILVSNLPEMSTIIKNYNVGEIVKNRDAKKLANQIEQILKKDFSKELKLAKAELIWEKQEQKLLAIFNHLK
ncbi:group 1 glycosyl transferase [Polaribacter sp. ALD11]|uniref:glycosyltransferase n=1 Tax=Polaribacter sp. ALD11 TaxID=2058137 RepID=UPI000C31A335|nr:glycosyltransferase [Polaribacter sp. ALD11]AUC86425.1 group 1 glycosyl transferase [Polaribacter sp. ALD11]